MTSFQTLKTTMRRRLTIAVMMIAMVLPDMASGFVSPCCQPLRLHTAFMQQQGRGNGLNVLPAWRMHKNQAMGLRMEADGGAPASAPAKIVVGKPGVYVRTVSLVRRRSGNFTKPTPSGKVGIGISFGRSSDGDVYVTGFVRGGAADGCGQIFVGDRILKVDEADVTGMSVADVVRCARR